MPDPGPASQFADTVEEVVAQLRKDPVLVEDLMSNGHTGKVTAALESKVDAADIPVYVVLTGTPRSLQSEMPDEELASLLHSRLGEDGVYYVATSEGHGHLGVWGDLDPEIEDDSFAFEQAWQSGMTQVREAIDQPDDYEGTVGPAKVTGAGIAADLAGEDGIASGNPLDADQVETYTQEMWTEHPVNTEPLEPVGGQMQALLVTAVGLTVAVVAYRLLQAWAARRDRPAHTTSRPDPTRVRAQADRALAELDRQLETASPGPGPELARHSRDAAERLRDSDEVLDVVGALVLARTGTHAVTSGNATTYRCCYVNPLHGEAEERADLGGGLEVPVCRRCRDDLAKDDPLEALLEVRRHARDRPYYTGETIWARTGFGALEDELWAAVGKARR